MGRRALALLVICCILSEVHSQRRRRFDGRRSRQEALERGERFRNGDTSDCRTSIVCASEPKPYRSADGSCNNKDHPDWGQAIIPMRRLMKPEYADQTLSTPRGYGDPDMPNPRAVSVYIHSSSAEQPDAAGVSHMVMQWGQFLDHDITHTPLLEINNGDETTSSYVCCEDDEGFDPEIVNNATICFPIRFENDEYFTNRNCFDFVRSVQVARPDCKSSPGEQVNQITAYIDGSNVYGSSIEEMNELRSGVGGLLKTNDDDSRLLPNDEDHLCDETSHCFKAGDERANEQMGLTSMHTLWVREHNRIARTLKTLNGHWDDKKLFSETRKIVGAMMQHITVNGFLPVVLGREITNYGLTTTREGHRNVYDKDVDASITNVFATAAYRFGHTLIRDSIDRYTSQFQVEESTNLRNLFGSTSILHSDSSRVDSFMRGMAAQNCKGGDRLLNTELTNHLFESSAGDSFDLAALNINRGRDHGLPGYIGWRKRFGLSENLDELDEMLQLELLALYNNKDENIDVFTGGLSEPPVAGGLVGPLFAAILGTQFERLMRGDRYWYENEGIEGFTRGQIETLRTVTLARVICDSARSTTSIQPDVFKMKNEAGNGELACDSLPGLDLDEWRQPPPPPPPSGPGGPGGQTRG